MTKGGNSNHCNAGSIPMPKKGTIGIESAYAQRLNRPVASHSINTVIANPIAVKATTCRQPGYKIQVRERVAIATTQNATNVIATSPTVARVQSWTAAQCKASAIPAKNGDCQISHTKLRRKEKITTFNSGACKKPCRARGFIILTDGSWPTISLNSRFGSTGTYLLDPAIA